MSGAGAFPFDPERLVALRRIADAVNGQHAPPPLPDPVVIDERGFVTLPVPHFDPPIVIDARLTGAMIEKSYVTCELHTGFTLQWAPMAEAGGLLVEIRGGPPDGVPDRDAVAAFVSRDGLGRLIDDLQAIAAALEADV